MGVIHENSGICIHLVHDDLTQSSLHDCRCLPTRYFDQNEIVFCSSLDLGDSIVEVWNTALSL